MRFKLSVKIGNVIKSTSVTNFGDIHVFFNKEFAGMSYPYFIKEICKGTPGSFLKVPAKS